MKSKLFVIILPLLAAESILIEGFMQGAVQLLSLRPLRHNRLRLLVNLRLESAIAKHCSLMLVSQTLNFVLDGETLRVLPRPCNTSALPLRGIDFRAESRLPILLLALPLCVLEL